MPKKKTIKTWQQFSRDVRNKGCRLFDHLGDYPEPVLVTGCQRSGTTLLSQILRHSEGFVNFQTRKDDELDAALILCGREKFYGDGRYCFQTTYVNECYHEYFKYKGKVKVIWMLRNPFSVVYSMLYNWESFALKELFLACGKKYHNINQRNNLNKWFPLSINKLTKACLSYKGKTEQLFELHEHFTSSDLLVIEYDDLILHNQKMLPIIYNFINAPYLEHYSEGIHAKSISKYESLSAKNCAIIEKHCSTVYSKAQKIIIRPPIHKKHNNKQSK